jgi:hypothetical protein
MSHLPYCVPQCLNHILTKPLPHHQFAVQRHIKCKAAHSTNKIKITKQMLGDQPLQILIGSTFTIVLQSHSTLCYTSIQRGPINNLSPLSASTAFILKRIKAESESIEE